MKMRSKIPFFAMVAVLLFFGSQNSYAQEKNNALSVNTGEPQSNYEPVGPFYDPWRDFGQIHRQIYQLMNTFPDDFYAPDRSIGNLDVYQDEEKYHIRLDLPGVKKENIEIEAKNQVLSIKALREDEWSDEGDQNGEYVYKSSRQYGSFQQSLRLPEDADPAKIEAEYKNGVLKISVPFQKKEKSNSLKIAVK